VTLEPCCHYGKTPPCTHAIIQNKISKVVVGCADPYHEVSGKGIKELIQAGIEVQFWNSAEPFKFLNRRFETRINQKRPYYIMKWAQSINGVVGSGISPDPLKGKISSALFHRINQGWRSEEGAIIVGWKTMVTDAPMLNVRSIKKNQPLRIVLDPNKQLKPSDYAHWSENFIIHSKNEPTQSPEKFLHSLSQILLEHGINSAIVEGGPTTHQHFISAGLWDECRVLIAPQILEGKVKATEIPKGKVISDDQFQLTGERLLFILKA